MDQLTRLGQGREAEVFALPDGLVLKLMRSASQLAAVERESTALTAVASDGALVPRVRRLVTYVGRPGIVLDRVDGPDLMTLVATQPWLLRRAGQVVADVQARLHDRLAPASLPDLKTELMQRISSVPALPPELAAWALSVLNGLPAGHQLCHGDLHVGNVLGNLSAPVVIDWGQAARGDPIADVANTWVVHRMGQPPPGTPAYVRMALPLARGIVESGHLSAYRRLRPFDRDLFRRWLIVCVAARFSAGIDEEVGRLTTWLRARYRRRLPRSAGWSGQRWSRSPNG